ncbi:MAG: GntR family transcriptional regulator [Bryobacteraceae bacterium]
MIPFRLSFQPGQSLYDQVVFAARKAIVAGQIRPGDPFPSVRSLSRELKINPNTAHKVVTHLTNEGLLEVRPGLGTVVAAPKPGSKEDRGRVLETDVERLVVDARQIGLAKDDVQNAVERHWSRLDGSTQNGGPRKK